MTTTNPHRSHIDDILGLIDNVLGPDDGGPTPDHFQLEPGPIVALQGVPRAHLRRCPPPPPPLPRSARGRYSVHALGHLTTRDLIEFLGSLPVRKLTNNTYVARYPNDTGGLRVILHDTTILFIYPGGDGKATYILNSGGYETTTTKQRLNALLPTGYRVFARRGTWFLSTPDGDVEFEDGMAIEA